MRCAPAPQYRTQWGLLLLRMLVGGVSLQKASPSRNPTLTLVPLVRGKNGCCTSLISPRFLCIDVFNTAQTTSRSTANTPLTTKLTNIPWSHPKCCPPITSAQPIPHNAPKRDSLAFISFRKSSQSPPRVVFPQYVTCTRQSNTCAASGVGSPQSGGSRCEVLAFSFALDALDGDFMNDSQPAHIDLQVMARQIMLEHGFEPDFPATVQQQLADIKARPPLQFPLPGMCATCATCSGRRLITTLRATWTRLK